MTKQELTKAVSEKLGVSTEVVRVTIEETTEEIKKAVARGDEVTLRGFGTFKRVHRAAKPCRNITKGETFMLAAHDIPAFKPSKEYKAMVK